LGVTGAKGEGVVGRIDQIIVGDWDVVNGDVLRRCWNVVSQRVLINPLQGLELAGNQVVGYCEVSILIGWRIIDSADKDIAPFSCANLISDASQVSRGSWNCEARVAADTSVGHRGRVANESLNVVVGEVAEKIAQFCASHRDGKFTGVKVEVAWEGNS